MSKKYKITYKINHHPDQLGDMLEKIIYPYITVTTADGTFTWSELREKYT